MTFIDLSDAEGMIGLFVELVADERAECRHDPERLRFVDDLLGQLRSVTADLGHDRLPAAVSKLKDIAESADRDFADDPVTAHLNDLIEAIDSAGIL